MDRYYYTVASLPALRWGEALPLDRSQAWERLRPGLSPADEAVLTGADLLPPRGLPTLDPAASGDSAAPAASIGGLLAAWYTWERTLRAELGRARLARLGFAAPEPLPEDRGLAQAETARLALAKDSPLEAEAVLDQARFAAVDDLAAGHWFDADALTAWWLKYLLLERQSRFDRARGGQALDAAYQSITALDGKRETS